ncbi:MAG: DUF5685 family protein [Lachnospiraceae bacterium]|jgi:hypothetical protein|nr:DUF5685 family protein [Lachnospiraceae bacterium]MDD3616914.1 DUF5685 family protein [Lachnospiraceae bacterium]
MFGYVTVHKDELKIKDYNYYRSCYCGLCRALKERHGFIAPLTLSYDMTFLELVLTGLYETQEELGSYRCMVHGGKKQTTRRNQWTDYAADMTILLAYYNLMDDWQDDKKVTKLMTAKSLEKAYKKVAIKYPRQTKAVEEYIRKTLEYEKAGNQNIDEVAGLTGSVLREIFVYYQDEWEKPLGDMAFYLGKFIYLMDAYEDLEADQKSKQYNLFIPLKKRDDFEAYVENMLIMMMSDCSRQFEILPILQNSEILRNILYSGVWVKYNMLKEKKNKKVEKKNGNESL